MDIHSVVMLQAGTMLAIIGSWRGGAMGGLLDKHSHPSSHHIDLDHKLANFENILQGHITTLHASMKHGNVDIDDLFREFINDLDTMKYLTQEYRVYVVG